MFTVADALTDAIRRLMSVTRSPRMDAQLILAHTLSVPRETLIAHSERALSPLEATTFDKLLTLRAHGMPIAYIFGQRAFMDRSFRVTSHVLIPRPETEQLVTLAVDWAHGLTTTPRVIDVGTGSGVIALSIAAMLPNARVVATDVSAAALIVAQDNYRDVQDQSNAPQNVTFVQSDLLAAFGTGTFDLIAANLPYIATGELDILEVAHFEPHVALDGGSDGLVLIRRLLIDAPRVLTSPGLLLLEHGADQGAAVLALAQSAFPNGQAALLKDDAGLDRVVRVSV